LVTTTKIVHDQSQAVIAESIGLALLIEAAAALMVPRSAISRTTRSPVSDTSAKSMTFTHTTDDKVRWTHGIRLPRLDDVTAQRIALVTGANQGIGYALVEGLAARWRPEDLVLLTGRNQSRLTEAAARHRNARDGRPR
jgi:hypothetical protein